MSKPILQVKGIDVYMGAAIPNTQILSDISLDHGLVK